MFGIHSRCDSAEHSFGAGRSKRCNDVHNLGHVGFKLPVPPRRMYAGHKRTRKVADNRSGSRITARKPEPSSTYRSFLLLAAPPRSPSTVAFRGRAGEASCGWRSLLRLPVAREILPFHSQKDPARRQRRYLQLADRKPLLPSRTAGCPPNLNSIQKHPLRLTLLVCRFAARGSGPCRI